MPAARSGPKAAFLQFRAPEIHKKQPTMQHLITSAVPGRVRLRDPALRLPRALAHMQSALRARAGVTRVKTNPHTGSVLLQYDSHALPPEQAHALLHYEIGRASCRERV